ncbi:hypothetical protein MPH_09440 [Macrophomina phaseolina MS6]|uniref:Ubiquitin-like protease family profile domain-containing protein n=1 Tax=Macrophomina phaseolina (strain MS6) TaxID=1126212 RepID=K2RT78_MACPH|nr:hypothetical protein MPH_09440 [Macrophomina phaseolina MS6]
MAPKVQTTLQFLPEKKYPKPTRPAPATTSSFGSKKRKSDEGVSGNATKKGKTNRGHYCAEYDRLKKGCEEYMERTIRAKAENKIDIGARRLNLAEMALAILSVTERISQHSAVKFCFYDAGNHANIWYGMTEMSLDANRDDKPLLLPWIIRSHHDSGDVLYNEDIASDPSHSILCDARPGMHGDMECVYVYIYDSYPSPNRKDAAEVEQQVEDYLKKSSWFKPNSGRYIFQWRDSIKHTITQKGGVGCGFHVILNAWIRAFGLMPSKAHLKAIGDEAFYEEVVPLVRMAIHGAASSDLIFAFLVCHGFIGPDVAVDGDRKFGRTIPLHNEDHARKLLPKLRNRENKKGLHGASTPTELSAARKPTEANAASSGSSEPPTKEQKAQRGAPDEAVPQKPKDQGGAPRALAKLSRDDYCARLEGKGNCTASRAACREKLVKNLELAGLDEPIDLTPHRDLGLSEIALGILSVTEAISSEQGNRRFCLYDVRACAADGVQSGPTSSSSGIFRGGYPILMPWAPNDGEGANRYLVHACMGERDGKPVVRCSIYTSFPRPAARNEEDAVYDAIIIRLIECRWYTRKEKVNFDFWWWHSRRNTVQQRGRTSGFHVLVNAWILALGLRPSQKNLKAVEADEHYRWMTGFIVSAIHGSLSFESLLAFLVCAGYVDADAVVPEYCRFTWTAPLHSAQTVTDRLARKRLVYGKKQTEAQAGKNGQVQGGDKKAGGEPAVYKETVQVTAEDAAKNMGKQRVKPAAKISQKDAPAVDTGSKGNNSDDPCAYYKARLWEETGLKDKVLKALRIEEVGVRWNKDLQDTEIIQAILAVTEAVSQQGTTKFSLYNPVQWTHLAQLIMANGAEKWRAVAQGQGTKFDMHRRDRPIIMPWGIYHNRKATRAEKAKSKQFLEITGTGGHHMLVMAYREASGDSEQIHVMIYDSLPRYALINREDAQRQIKEMLSTSWSYPTDTKWLFEWPPVLQQRSSTGCGINAILSAWSLALGLQPPSAARGNNIKKTPDQFYKHAADIIRCAVHGTATLDTIMAFFRCWDFLEDPKKAVEPSRKFNKTFAIQTDYALRDLIEWRRKVSEDIANEKQAAKQVESNPNDAAAATGPASAESNPLFSKSPRTRNPFSLQSTAPALHPFGPKSSPGMPKSSGPGLFDSDATLATARAQEAAAAATGAAKQKLQQPEPTSAPPPPPPCLSCPIRGHCRKDPNPNQKTAQKNASPPQPKSPRDGWPTSARRPWLTASFPSLPYYADVYHGAALKNWVQAKHAQALAAGYYPDPVPAAVPWRDKHLGAGLMVRAMHAVTEGVSAHAGPDDSACYSVSAYARARDAQDDKRIELTERDVVVGTRQPMWFPLVMQWKEQRQLMPGEQEVHLVEVFVARAEDMSKCVVMNIFTDEVGGRSHDERREVEGDARSLLKGLKWWEGLQGDGAGELPRDRIKYEWVETRRRSSRAAGSLHVVLDAWCRALGLCPTSKERDKACLPGASKEEYQAYWEQLHQRAAELIARVVHGCINAEQLLASLRALDWLDEDGPPIVLDEAVAFKSAVAFPDDKALQGHFDELYPRLLGPASAAHTTGSAAVPWITKPFAFTRPYDPSFAGKALDDWLDEQREHASRTGAFRPLHSIPRVPRDAHLSDGQMIRAIMAVTEAIGQRHACYGVRTYERARSGESELSREDVIIGKRRPVFLPLVVGQREGVVARRECDVHLLEVHHDRINYPEQPIVMRYWTDHIGMSLEQKVRVQTEAIKLVRRLKWWHDEEDASDDDNNDKLSWSRHIWTQTMHRSTKAAGSLHVVLDAWCSALNLTPNDTERAEVEKAKVEKPEAYQNHWKKKHEIIASLIDVATQGWMNAELLVAHLRSLDWARETGPIDLRAKGKEDLNFRSGVAFPDDKALQQHIDGKLPRSSTPYSGGKGKDQNDSGDRPTCLNCPVNNHCAKKDRLIDGNPMKKRSDTMQQRKWKPAFWPEVLKEYPCHCQFATERLKTLRELAASEELKRGSEKVAEDFSSKRGWAFPALIRAIASVTEAISMNGYQGNKDEKALFSLYDWKLSEAMAEEGGSGKQALRLKSLASGGRRGKCGEQIIIPLAYNHLVTASTRRTSGIPRPEITHYYLNDPTEPALPNDDIKTQKEGEAETVLDGMHWFHGPLDMTHGTQRYHHTWYSVAPLKPLPEYKQLGNQSKDTGAAKLKYLVHAGLHLVLNAWVIAFGFRPPTTGLRFTDYADLWELVLLACQGIIDSATIVGLLRCVGWIQGEGVEVPESRRFNETARFVDNEHMSKHFEWVKLRSDLLDRWSDLPADYRTTMENWHEKMEEAKRRSAEDPEDPQSLAAWSAANHANIAYENAAAKCPEADATYKEAAARYSKAFDKDKPSLSYVLNAKRELLYTPGCSPAFLGQVPKLIAEDEQNGKGQESMAREAKRQAERAERAERANKATETSSLALGKRKRDERLLVVNSESDVYQEMLTQHKGKGLQRARREDLAKLFENPPQNVYAPNIFRRMVDAAERYFFAYENA